MDNIIEFPRMTAEEVGMIGRPALPKDSHPHLILFWRARVEMEAFFLRDPDVTSELDLEQACGSLGTKLVDIADLISETRDGKERAPETEAAFELFRRQYQRRRLEEGREKQ